MPRVTMHVPLEPVLRVEHRDVELLDRQVLHPRREIAATSCGPRNGTPASRASNAMRRPSSSAACTAVARACPTPFTLVSAATGVAANRPRSRPRTPAPRGRTATPNLRTPRAQDHGDQFGGAQRLGTERPHPLAWTLGVRELSNS